MLPSAFTVRLKLIGQELRAYRDAAGLTLREVEHRFGIDTTRLCRLETGEREPRCDEVAGLLAVYGVVGAERRYLLELLQDDDRHGLLQRHRDTMAQRIATLKFLESHATRIISFESLLIPGLLQTVPYAQALMRNVGMFKDDVIDDRVARRIRRQAVLRKAVAPQFEAIIMEHALRNVVGDPAVMREQLVYLTEAARRPNITIRIIPASAGNHPGFEGPFHWLSFRHRHGVVALMNRTFDLYLEDDSDRMAYNLVLVELLSVALDQEGSIALLGDIATQLA
jgi:transcriptional regulator with XRE-family HTH domain